jgi:hypothetical protein
MELAFDECSIWELGFVIVASDPTVHWVSQEAYQQVKSDRELGRLLFRDDAECYCTRVMVNRLDDAEALIKALEHRVTFNLLKQSYS